MVPVSPASEVNIGEDSKMEFGEASTESESFVQLMDDFSGQSSSF